MCLSVEFRAGLLPLGVGLAVDGLDDRPMRLPVYAQNFARRNGFRIEGTPLQPSLLQVNFLFYRVNVADVRKKAQNMMPLVLFILWQWLYVRYGAHSADVHSADAQLATALQLEDGFLLAHLPVATQLQDHGEHCTDAQLAAAFALDLPVSASDPSNDDFTEDELGHSGAQLAAVFQLEEPHATNAAAGHGDHCTDAQVAAAFALGLPVSDSDPNTDDLTEDGLGMGLPSNWGTAAAQLQLSHGQLAVALQLEGDFLPTHLTAAADHDEHCADAQIAAAFDLQTPLSDLPCTLPISDSFRNDFTERLLDFAEWWSLEWDRHNRHLRGGGTFGALWRDRCARTRPVPEGFRERQTTADGSCFFDAVSVTREAAAACLQTFYTEEDLQQAIAADAGASGWEQYLKQIRDGNAWGGEPELIAISETTGRSFRIWDGGRDSCLADRWTPFRRSRPRLFLTSTVRSGLPLSTLSQFG